MATGNPVDRFLVLPARAFHFTRDTALPSGDRLGQLVAQIKIAAHAFVVQAIDAKHGARPFNVHRVLDLAIAGAAVRVQIGEINGQGLQFLKSFRERRRLTHSQAFFLSIVGTGRKFLRAHTSCLAASR